MKNIVICGSAKYMEEIYILAEKLRNKEYNVTDLKMVPYPITFDVNEKLANKGFYFDEIREADLVLVYNKDGYIGLSTAMEIQFSLDNNRHRPLRFLFETKNIECLAICISSNYNTCIDKRWLNV